MNKLRFFFSLLIFISSISAGHANQSVRIWSEYFPDMNCSRNPCGRNLPADALEEFLSTAHDLQRRKLNSTNWAFLVDFTIPSSRHRGFLINMKTGASEGFHVSHGIGSDDGRGNAVRFSNRNESHMSSLGLYLAAETYYGKHGYSLRMDGLQSTNSNARRRAIVVHPADYMSPSFIKSVGRSGRSHGCPALAPAHSRRVIDSLKGRSLYYIYHQ